jgi:hypothetical protein
MLKIITVVAAVATAAVAFTGTSQPAQARGGAVAAGVIGGLAAGAIIGSAANRSYYSGPAYAEPYYQPVYHNCRVEREWDGFRYHRVRVCD